MSKVDLSGMSAPGVGFKPPESGSLPAVILVPVVPTGIDCGNFDAPAPKAAPAAQPAKCSACGQLLPEPVAAPVPAGPSPLDAEWNDLERTDLSPRTQPQIAALLAAGETEQVRERRITNDKLRWLHQQGRY